MSAPDSNASCGCKSRRDFLKFSGRLAAASTLTLSPRLSAGAPRPLAGANAPSIYAGENNTIKLALVGCGGRGTGAVADAFSTTGGPVKLHAMADLFEQRLAGSLKNLKEGFADKVDVPPQRQFVGFDAYKKAIDCLKPGDVAVLATHAAFRPLHFEYAVAKGVNVFMEKSFAVDSPAVRRLLKAAEVSQQKNLKVGVGFMWRHSKARQEVIQRIHDGAIGQVHTLRIYRVHGPIHCPPWHGLPARENTAKMAVPPANVNELVFQLQNPNSFTWVSSGFFIDWHCHNIDVACWAKGAWPVSAQAMGGRCYEQSGNQFDHYTVEYTFGDGTKLFAFSRHMNGCWETYSDYAHGSKGSAVIMTSLGAPKPRIYKSHNMVPQELVWEYGPEDCNPYIAEWQVLLDAIRHNKPHNEARRAGEANVAALMGRMAAHTGQYITWEQAANSDFQFVKDIDSMTFDSPAPIHPRLRGDRLAPADAGGPDGIYPAPQPGITKEV